MIIPENWQEENNCLMRVFEFKDFQAALNFVVKVGELAEMANHHPDIEIFGYNKVKLKLTTHSAGRTITDKDINLAEEITKFYL